MHIRFLLLALVPLVAESAPNSRVLPLDEISVIRTHFSRPNLEKNPAVIVLDEKAVVSLTVEPGVDWKDKLRKSVRRADNLVAEAIEDFISKNSSEWSFAGLEIPPLKVVTVSAARRREIFFAKPIDPERGWTRFREAYGSVPLFSMSRVGFSADRQVAIYYVMWGIGPQEGEGRMHVVRKKAEEWQEDHHVEFVWGFRA